MIEEPLTALLGAMFAATLAFIGVLISTSKADKRTDRALSSADADREQNNLREREASRHHRFSQVIEQLASDKSAVRMGGLFTLAALADEWDEEARRLLAWPDEASSAPKTDRQPLDGGEDGRRAAPLRVGLVGHGAKAAVGQRDACIGLLCAYLRAYPIGALTPIGEGNQLTSSAGRRSIIATEEMPWIENIALMPDRDARQEAIAILWSHTRLDSINPWPGEVINLTGAHLQRAKLTGARLERAYLYGAHLERAYLCGANLQHANLTDASLEHADLSETVLTGAIFRRAKLREADLRRSNLVDADTKSAELQDAKLPDGYSGGISH